MIGRLSRLVSISYLSIYLYLLFTSGYMASPLIVLINYLAIYTSFSGLITFKYFEIPSILLSIKEAKEKAPFFSLANKDQERIWNDLKNEIPLPANFDANWISTTLRLEERQNWKRIGKIYLGKYIFLFLLSSFYLLSVYLETGFRGS